MTSLIINKCHICRTKENVINTVQDGYICTECFYVKYSETEKTQDKMLIDFQKQLSNTNEKCSEIKYDTSIKYSKIKHVDPN